MLWVKATKEKFEENGQEITTERQLQDGEYIKHFELSVPDSEAFLLAIRFKTSIEILSEEQLETLLALEPQEV